MSNELPQGWDATKLDDVAERITKGATPTSYGFKYLSKGISFVKVENLKAGFVDRRSIRHFISEEAHQNQKRSILREGDILFSIAGTIGATCIVRREDLPANTNQALSIIRGTTPTFLPDFLRRQLESEVTISQARAKERGGGMHNISLEDVKEMTVMVAPLNEQRRIVAKLEKLLHQVDACQERLAKIPSLLKRFRQSVLAAACSGRLTTDWRGSKSPGFFSPPVNIGLPEEAECVEGWAWRKLTDLARLESGHTPRKTTSEYWEGGDVPWISLQDIRAANGKIISETKLMPTMNGIDNSSARMLPAGTVVFSRDISVGYVTIMGREMATSQHFADWICGPELNNRYLMSALMASRDHLMSSQQGSTVGTIYMPALKEFQLLTPRLPEQLEIVCRVESMFSLADGIEVRFTEARKQVDQLSQAVLAKAFRGELVPTEFELAKAEGRSFESAGELLERIGRNGTSELKTATANPTRRKLVHTISKKTK